MIRLIFILALGLSLVSCRHEPTEMLSKTKHISVNKILKYEFSNFDLLFENSKVDRKFLFGKKSRWDTSFVFTLSKVDSNYFGRAYELSPTDGLITMTQDSIAFFSGFSFRASDKLWSRMEKEFDRNQAPAGIYQDRGCVDCTEYIMVRDSTFKMAGKETLRSYEDLDKVIRAEIRIRQGAKKYKKP